MRLCNADGLSDSVNKKKVGVDLRNLFCVNMDNRSNFVGVMDIINRITEITDTGSAYLCQ